MTREEIQAEIYILLSLSESYRRSAGRNIALSPIFLEAADRLKREADNLKIKLNNDSQL